MELNAGCKTTAMGIMPHKDISRALDLVLSLDIPYWPQLPNLSLYEDMYVQSSRNFPGLLVDMNWGRLDFNKGRFYEELDAYFEKTEYPDTFSLGKDYSVAYARFLECDLSEYAAIRGQITGPVSFGMKVLDEELKPMIYDDEVRGVLFDFIQAKMNTQFRELSRKNTNAFVWVDEPGLGGVFSALVGYGDLQAKEDYRVFVDGLEGPKGLHLCANVDLPYLLDLGVEILSFDAYQLEFMPKQYAGAVATFLKNGGIIAWGIVPTDSANLIAGNPNSFADMLMDYWAIVSTHGSIDLDQIAAQSLIAPARCCLRDIAAMAEGENGFQPKSGDGDITPEEQIVETAFDYLKQISEILQREYL